MQSSMPTYRSTLSQAPSSFAANTYAKSVTKLVTVISYAGTTDASILSGSSRCRTPSPIFAASIFARNPLCVSPGTRPSFHIHATTRGSRLVQQRDLCSQERSCSARSDDEFWQNLSMQNMVAFVLHSIRISCI